MGIVDELVTRQRRERQEEEQIASRMNAAKSATKMMLDTLAQAVERESLTYNRETGDLSLGFRTLAHGNFVLVRSHRIPAFSITVEMDPPYISWTGFIKEANDTLQREISHRITIVSPRIEEYFYRLDGQNNTEAELLDILLEPIMASVLHVESQARRHFVA